MVTLDDAERLARRWADGQAGRRPYALTAMVREFDLGFVIWLKEPPSVMPEPGDGARTVLDRQTGALTQFPSLPVDQVIDMYRQRVAAQPPPPPTTIDANARIRRNARQAETPTVAAHLTLRSDRRLRRAFGAKGDQTLNHHGLVREWLAAQEPGALVRGVERHAELIAISDLLHEVEAGGRPAADLASARGLVSPGSAVIEFFQVREQAEGLGGSAAIPCPTCAQALAHLGAAVDRTAPDQVVDGRPYDVVFAPSMAGRPPALTGVLQPPADPPVDQGSVWESMRQGLEQAGHPVFEPVRDAFLRYGGLRWLADSPGVDLRVRPFRIGVDVRPCPEALASFGDVLGTRLAPIGVEGPDQGILAVDEQGRVFALDQGGEWFVGGDIDTAVVNLIYGAAQPRVRDDMGW